LFLTKWPLCPAALLPELQPAPCFLSAIIGQNNYTQCTHIYYVNTNLYFGCHKSLDSPTINIWTYFWLRSNSHY